MRKNYGFLGFLRLIKDYVFTKVFYPKSRIIRTPFYIRGSKFIDLGKNLTTGVNVRLDAFSQTNEKGRAVIKIGDNVQLNDYVHIGAIDSVIIGDGVLIASKVFITDHNHGKYTDEVDSSHPDTPPASRPWFSKKVVIEDNVWIGEFVSILPGVTIGKGSIIGAMSVVSKSIPPYSIAVGIPATVIKKYNFNAKAWEKIER